MYQELCHDLAQTITEMSRCAADDLTHGCSIYRSVVDKRNAAAQALKDQLPKELRASWDKYQVLLERFHFMEQEMQFFRGYCSYPILMDYFKQDTVSQQKLTQELLEKFR